MKRAESKSGSTMAAILSDLHFWMPLLVLLAGVVLMIYLR
jgi:hypothetical protein